MTTRVIISGSFATGQTQTRIELNDKEVFFREVLADLLDEVGFDEDKAEEQFQLLMYLRRQRPVRAHAARLPR